MFADIDDGSCENIAIWLSDSNYAEFDENANLDDGSVKN